MSEVEGVMGEVALLLARAERPLFITGAGISADSGLPTYRGIGGLYEGRLTEESVPIEEALSGGMLRERPEVTWRYLHEIGRACREGRPNRGHAVIAEVEALKPGTWVLTQNVDGLHRAAGSRNLIEIHGRMDTLSCGRCFHRIEVDESLRDVCVPRCPRCDGVLRPDAVLFGEALPSEAVERLEAELVRGFDLVFSVGTSSLFPYIAEPVLQAARRGVPTVEINPSETVVSDLVEFRIAGRAAPVLDALWGAATAMG